MVAALREEFVCGRLFPDQSLSILELSAHYRLSPTPVREALGRLVGEGLVVVASGGGYACAPLDAAQLGQLRRLEHLVLGALTPGRGAAVALPARLRLRAVGRPADAADVHWLFGEAARASGDVELEDVLRRIGGRLGVVRRVEAVGWDELGALAAAFATDGPAWRAALDRASRRRHGREAETLDAVRRLEAKVSERH
ncbi:MAG: GntR family transcriptional regulator [Caulobacteraceae bacterium]|nr:GntR family transcriptional regulator [Caulobacter sp.]